MLKSYVDYPTQEQEKEILQQLSNIESHTTKKVLSASKLLKIRKTIDEIQVSDNIMNYITHITQATRNTHPHLRYGISPR